MKKLNHLLVAVLSLAAISIAHASDNEQDLITKGEYLARAGDCTACHSVAGGEPYAGGLKLSSGLGVIYSTNITPSKNDGIGNYTEEQFAKAVRKGVRADGAYLYPAMPYPDYQAISDEDIHALYTYFMKGVKPVDKPAPATDLGFPFNQRWGLRFWNMVFTTDKPFTPGNTVTDDERRGKYLVETLGHCGSCHTPRAITMQEKSYTDADKTFLAGGELNGWPVPPLRHLPGWSDQDITDYLSTGRNRFAAVGGEMTSVVEHSMQYMNGQDLKAIAAYLKSLPDDASIGNMKVNAATASKDTTATLTASKDLSEGQVLYLNNCEACHWTDGKGAKGIFPHLDGSDIVRQDNPNALIGTILHGAATPATHNAPSVLYMPGFGKRLNDKQVADLATFIRSGWSNNAPAVSEKDVKKVREASE